MSIVNIDKTMKKISFSLGVDVRFFHLKENVFEIVSISLGREEVIKIDKDIIYDPSNNSLTTNRDDIDIYSILYDNALILVNKGPVC